MFAFLGVIIIIMLIISYYMFNKDIFAPPFILMIVFMISYLCALYNYDVWNLTNYSINTVILLASCFIIFFISSLIAKLFTGKKNEKSEKVKKIETKKIIHISLSKKIIILALFIFVFIWNIHEVQRIASISGKFTDFSTMMNVYRKVSSYSISTEEQKLPFLLNQLSKVITVISYLYAYILIRNLFNKDKIKNNILYIVTIIVFGIYALTTGGRMPILKLLAAGFTFYYVFYNRNKNWQLKNNSKFINVGLKALIILLVGFYASKTMVGRLTEWDPLAYVTMYTGGSIKLIDSYIVSPPEKSTIFGKETFFSINKVLAKIGIIDTYYIKHLEFRYTNSGIFLGNVYTAFRRYHSDFGIFGCWILVATYSFIISYYFYSLKEKVMKRNDYTKDKQICIFSLIIYTLFLYSIDDQFFTVVLSINYLSLVLMMYILYEWIVNDKFKLKIRG